MRRKAVILSVTLFLLVSSMPITSNAAEAGRFIIKIKDAETINFDTDHYSVSLVKGWVYTKDGFFKNLLSEKAKLIIATQEDFGFFGGEKLNLSSMYENGDISKDTNRPWGQNILLINNIPADSSTRITIRLSVNREDRISKIFAAAEASKAELPVDLLASPWVGYSKLVSNLIGQFFGTSKTDVPFYWSGDVKLGDVTSLSTMAGHYIVLISPQKDTDTFISTLDNSKLTYDDASKQLKYDGTVVTDRSYAVLKVTKSEGYDVAKYTLSSSDAWAVLANNQFSSTATNDAKTGEQLSALAGNALKQLQNMTDLLKREIRFSKYDRAVALTGFAGSAKIQIDAKCKQLELKGAACPDNDLDQFEKNLIATFNIPENKKPQLKIDSTALSHSLMGIQ